MILFASVLEVSLGEHPLRPGPCFNIKDIFPGVGIPIMKIRQSYDSIIFIMGIPILVRLHLYLDMAPLSDK